MADQLFRYKKEIDNSIPRCVAEVLQTEVLTVEKFLHGEVNHVYKVETRKGVVVIRVFRNKYWPGVYKMQRVHDTLRDARVRTPELLYLTDDSTYFPNGFMISEFIDGINAEDALASGQIAHADFYEKLITFLSHSHQIVMKQYGYLISDDEYADFLSFKTEQINDIWEKHPELPADTVILRKEVEKEVLPVLHKYASRISPILVHRDPTPNNCLITPQRELVLIDWDNATAECFMRDFAWLTYWEMHIQNKDNKSEEDKLWWEMVKNIYPTEFKLKELKELEKAYHITIAAELLPYYYSDQENMKEYREAEQRLHNLLQ